MSGKILLPLLFLSFILTACSGPKSAEVRVKKVTKVGGCDRAGRCIVELEDGTLSGTYYPIAGHKSKIYYCNGKPNLPKFQSCLELCQ